MPESKEPELLFDHAVIAVADLEVAMSDYASLGFTARFGGEHPGRSTHNALVYFSAGNYLELIAERPDLPPTCDARENWVRDALQEGRALLTYALRSEDLEQTVAACAQRGFKLDGPYDGARNRPDGARVAWRGATTPNPFLPFLIEDVSPRELRISEAMADVRHANGARGVQQVVLLAADVVAVAAAYEPLLGQTARQANGEAQFSLGSTGILIRSPESDRERTYLGGAAAIPYALTLRGDPPLELDVTKSGFPLSIQR